MRYVVSKAHRPSETEWLSGKRGTRLVYERRETEYPGWIWCVTEDGVAGWVPEARVTLSGESCTLLRDYDALELKLDVGEAVEAELTESGWAFVADARGRRGWVPLERLQAAEGATA